MADGVVRPPMTIATGIGLKVLSVMLFAGMEGLSKQLTTDYSVVEVAFFRHAFAFVPLFPFLLRNGGIWNTIKTDRPFSHLFRSMFGLSALLLILYAISKLPLTDVASILFTAPILITALSVPLLGEAVGIRRWSAVCVGFVGVLIILNPAGNVFDIGALAAFAGALLSACALITVRRLSRTEPSARIVFYFTLMGTAMTAAALPWFWTTPTLIDLAMLISIGILGGLGQITMTYAVHNAPVSIIVPFDYTKLIWVVILDLVIWSSVPDPRVAVGATIIVMSGLYILHREGRVRKTKAKQGS